jgi:uncharacterized protein YodC (DUF2158 family)
MRFKSGDIVIKKTGGNKMTISQIYLNESIYHYKCYWFVENKLFEELFQEDQLVTLDEYKSILKVEERDDKINQILKS